MLIGNHRSKLDSKKGRVALPAKFRQFLGSKIIITMGHEQTLMIVPKKSWQSITRDIVNRPFISEPARDTDRFLLGNAYEVDLDVQGRFIVPLALKKYAKLSQNIVFVGMGNRVEVWDQEKWQERLSYLSKNINRITTSLSKTDEAEK